MSSTNSARTTLSVQQKTRSSCFLPKEWAEVCLFSYWILFANNHLLLAISRELSKFDSHGNQRNTQIIIEFTITAVSKANDAAVLNMEEAVAQGKGALVHMMPASSSLAPIQGAVDTSVVVVTTLTAIWGPFLQKVKLFTELVDGIARVSGRTDELSEVSDRISRSTHTLKWRGAFSLLYTRSVLRTLYFIWIRTFHRPSWPKLIATAPLSASSRSWTMFSRSSRRPNP